MSYKVGYTKNNAPRVGIFFNAIGAFSLKGKEQIERQFTRLFGDFKKRGIISPDSILKERRIFGPHEAHEIAGEFGKKQVDVVIIVNSAFPNGNVFSTIASDPYLSKIPVIITADREPVFPNDKEWTTNAWCGVIMNNYAAKHMGHYIRTLAGCPDDESYRDKLKLLLNVYNSIARMRNDYMGRFGEAPGGFHSAATDELALTMLIGTRIDTVDLTAVMDTYVKRKAKGLKREAGFTDKDVRQTAAKMRKGRVCLVDDSMLNSGARLYHAFRAIIEANGFTSAAFRCWPELQSDIVPYTPCLVTGQLLADRVVTAASCESDCLNAVAQSFGTLLSGEPAALLDFVNYTGGSNIIQLGHCGCGIPGSMAPNDAKLINKVKASQGRATGELKRQITAGKVIANDAISISSPPKQCGFMTGPNLIGQFRYGSKTGLDFIRTSDGKYKMLVFTGKNDKSTAMNLLNIAADIRVKNYKKLDELVLGHGFSHHLAVAMDDISKEMQVLCEYYGIEYFNPDI